MDFVFFKLEDVAEDILEEAHSRDVAVDIPKILSHGQMVQ